MGKFYLRKSKTISGKMIVKSVQPEQEQKNMVINDDIKIVEEELPVIKKR